MFKDKSKCLIFAIVLTLIDIGIFFPIYYLYRNSESLGKFFSSVMAQIHLIYVLIGFIFLIVALLKNKKWAMCASSIFYIFSIVPWFIESEYVIILAVITISNLVIFKLDRRKSSILGTILYITVIICTVIFGFGVQGIPMILASVLCNIKANEIA